MIAKYGTFEYVLAEHYRFEEQLGRGAMGTVYRAKDVRLGRPVAIKMLHPLLTNEVGVARFQSEIRIAAGLHHPNIIGIHDCGEADGHLYYVMDYLGGETLRARLDRDKQLPIDDALAIAEQVGAGLQYAHDHAVVHRDIKPENIVLADDRACIVDFGLARALNSVDVRRLTSSGISVGTPMYLSPEQAAAEREVGPKADQYSLAVTLYEMLVGEVPFTGPTASVIAMRHISEQPPLLRNRRRTTPPHVEAAVARALQKIPADRFGSDRDFTCALRGLSRPTPPANAMIPAAASPTVDQQSRTRSATLARAALALLCVATVIGIGLAARQHHGPAVVMRGPTLIALLPLTATSGQTGASPGTVDAVLNGLRLFRGAAGVPLPPVSAQRVASDASLAVAPARQQGAAYVALIAGFGERHRDIRVEVVDTRSGDSLGSEEITADSTMDMNALGASVAVSIARAIASRDSTFGQGLRVLFHSTRSAEAISRLVSGQRRFAKGDVSGAAAEYRRALVADPTCSLAFYRLSAAAAWEYRYADALAYADSGLKNATDPRAQLLLRAQRYLAMQMADSAISGFVDSVGDDPDNVDGWFGLSQAMYNFGWEVGYRLADARTAFDRVLHLDSAYAPIHGLFIDVTVAAGDMSAAKAVLPRIDAGLPWGPAKAILVHYAAAAPAGRDSILSNLKSADQYTLSELVLQLSRALRDTRAADRVALEMQSSRRAPESRRRGQQYRLAFTIALGRGADSVRTAMDALSGGFDSWVGAAALAELAADKRTAMRAAALSLLPVHVSERDIADGSRVDEAIDYLVQDALDDSSSARANALEEHLRPLIAGSATASASVYAWQQSLAARMALTRHDTSAAIAALQRATHRSNAIYGAFLPLASLPTQRLVLLRLLRRTRAPKSTIDPVESSFDRSWSIADDLFKQAVLTRTQ